jgi:DNA polymerase III epsilon subunit-like protein
MPIIAVDTETGGFDPRVNTLLSVSLVELDRDFLPTRTLDVFILPDPGKVVTPEAARINGYTPDKWAERGAVGLQAAMKKIAAWMPRQSEALAHNAGFDKAFVDDAEKATGVRTWLHPRWRCSMVAFLAVNDALLLGAPDAKLETLAKMSGHWAALRDRGAHESLDDALACAAGYRWLLAKIRAGEAKGGGTAAAAAGG